MEKHRQVKMLSIIALIVAVSGMTFGFAAFSTTLNISSSATVTPSSDDFKIVIYGISEEKASSITTSNELQNSSFYTSKTISAPVFAPSGTSVANIKNQNKEIIIDNMKLGLTKATDKASYVFMIKNEGKYDAYVDLEQIGTYECSSIEEMTPNMASACSDAAFDRNIFLTHSDGREYYLSDKIVKPGDYIICEIQLYFISGVSAWPDGFIEFTYPDIKFTFSTTQ